ncbi:hypothetical protein NQ317_018297, partial [Molorchus minor]
SESLGSGRPVLENEQTPAESSCGDMASSDVENLEDARKLVRDLRQKTRAQAQQIMAWRRAYKMQRNVINSKRLAQKLLLFESRLIRKQKDISAMLNIRENIIHRQQRIIETLSNRLIDNGLEMPQAELTELESNLPDLDSLNDSDSAVVMEDVDSDSNIYHIPKFRSASSDGVTIVRSISDAIDPNLKYTSVRRNNGFLRRPEILETVYSVEEDADNDQENKSEANKKRETFATKGKSNCNIEAPDVTLSREKSLEEKVCGVVPSWPYTNNSDKNTSNDESTEETPKSHVKTYNRVMSNHRSVTKPKDVKYKRINKAKSKSLEELRGEIKKLGGTRYEIKRIKFRT